MNSPHTTEMLHLISGFHVSRALYVAAKLGLADLLHDGVRTCAGLAQATATDAAALYRLLRVLASAGVVELDAEQVRATASMSTLRSGVDGSLRGWAIDQLGGEHYQAWGELLHSVTTGTVAFEKVFGQNAWDHRAAHPESAKAFDEGMASFTGAHHQAVLKAYPFGALASLHDIGGGDGQFITAALSAHPQLRGVLLDQPHVAARARQRLHATGLAARCTVVEGNMFEAIPGGGAATLLSRVIHDWSDAEAARILSVCRRDMNGQGVLLLVERVLPAQMDTTPAARALTVSDLNMLVMTGGRERTEAQYRALLEGAGFTLDSVTATSTVLSVIEARPR